jgi:hypothetical protein
MRTGLTVDIHLMNWRRRSAGHRQASRWEAAEPTLRTHTVVASLAATGSLHDALQILSTVEPFQITTDRRARKTTCSVDIDARVQSRPPPG